MHVDGVSGVCRTRAVPEALQIVTSFTLFFFLIEV